MATVKRKNNKIILKKNKVSCSCCISCNQPFDIGERNVFEITRQKYNQYFSGGTWNITASLSVTVNSTYNNPNGGVTTMSVLASLQETYFRIRSGCFHQFSLNQQLGQNTTIVIDPSGNTDTNTGIFALIFFRIDLKENNGRYYVKYSTEINCSINIFPLGMRRGFKSTGTSNNPYPSQVQSIIDGNNLSLSKIGVEPYWILRVPPTPSIPWTTWNETSSATLNATFTPA